MKKLILTPILLLFLTSGYAAQNQTILQGFYWYIPDAGSANENEESNLWRLMANGKANEIADIGFTHVWLPPASKAFSPNTAYNVGYAVYDNYDLGEFDQMGGVRTKYGTKDELLSAVNSFHNNGVKVIADVVMNHMMGGSQPSEVPYSYGFTVHDNYVEEHYNGTVTAYTDFNFNRPDDRNPRNGRYSDFVWNASHFDGLENWDTYYIFQGKTSDKVSIFNDFDPAPNNNWDIYQQLRTDTILGLDLDYENMEVQDHMIEWSKWLVNEVGFDGFRVDAIRHMHIPFVHRWANEMRDYMNSIGKGEDLKMFGEFWDGWAERLNAYLVGDPNSNDVTFEEKQNPYEYAGIKNSMDLFDVPLHFDFQKIAGENHSFPPTRMIDLPDRGLLAKNPQHTITFVDNHDTVPTQELESYIPLHTKIQAYTFILLHEFGTPTVFYRDMFKGNFVSEYENSDRDYLNYHLRKLIELRNNNAYGRGTFYRDGAKPGILGYKRDGDWEHPNSGLIYLIRENGNYDNGIKIPTDNDEWELVMGDGNIYQGTFYLNNDAKFAVWKRK